MKRSIILSLIFLPFVIKGQFTFQKRYNVNQNETAHGTEQTAANEYLLSGYSNINTLFLKVDSVGNPILAQKYNIGVPSVGTYIHQTTDGGNIICGEYRPQNTGRLNTFLLKTDSVGNVQWARQFSISQNDVDPYGFILMRNGNFVVCGRLSDIPYSTFIFSTDSLGNLQWGRRCHNQANGPIIPSDLIQLQNGNILVFGNESGSHVNIYLVEINSIGITVREKIFHNSSYDQERGHIRQTNDGGFVFTGQVYINNVWSHMLLAKIDSVFNLQWVKKYDGLKSRYSFGLTIAHDGGYVFGGILYDSLFHDTVFVAKTDGNGIVSWSRKFDFSSSYVYLKLSNTNDHGFALSGTIEPSQLNYQAILLKIDSLGNSNCNSEPFISTAYNSGFNPYGVYLTFSNYSFTDSNLAVVGSTTMIFESIECASLGKSELIHENIISFYPNPFTSTIVFHFPDTQKENASLRIFNAIGQVVLEKNIVIENQSLDLSSLPRGIYLVNIISNQEIFSEKIVKD